MARGFGMRFLGGVVSGAAASSVVVGAMSVLAPPPVAPDVSDASPSGVLAPPAVTQADSGKTPSQTDTAVAAPNGTLQTLAPDPDTVAVIDSATQASADVPQTGDAAGLEPPAATAEGTIAPDGDAPVQTTPQAAAPVQPQAEAQAQVNTDPADLPAQDTPLDATDEAALAGNETLSPLKTGDAEGEPVQAPSAETDEAAQEDQAPQVAATQDTQTPSEQAAPVADGTAPVSQNAEAETQTAEGDTQTAVADAQTGEGDTQTAEADTPTVEPDTQIAEADTQEATAPDVPQIVEDAEPAPEAGSVADETPEETPEEKSEETVVAAARPAVGTPAASLLNRDTGVTINRPQTTDTTQGDAVPATADATPAAAGGSNRPVDLYAQPFEAEADKPLMSIVLIDDGTTPTAGAAGIAALRSFPYPLSFAVDSRLDDAADRIALYRDKGFEVMVMIDLPAGAQPVDAETTFGVVLAKLQNVVGVLEGTGTGFQESRDLADQVSAIVAQSGHGLLTQARGLNTMPKLARKDGVPAAPVFRDFDSKDQSATVIRRFLDQAAFKAGQEGAVVMLGRMRPDTISALLLWGLQDRAGSVALSPVSAVLKRDP